GRPAPLRLLTAPLAEHHDHANHTSGFVRDGSRGLLDSSLRSLSRNQEFVRVGSLQRSCNRACDRGVDEAPRLRLEYLSASDKSRSSASLSHQPVMRSAAGFKSLIVPDAVRGDNAIPDAALRG